MQTHSLWIRQCSFHHRILKLCEDLPWRIVGWHVTGQIKHKSLSSCSELHQNLKLLDERSDEKGERLLWGQGKLSVHIYHNTRFRADTVRLCERLEYVSQDWGKTKTNLLTEHTLQTTNHYIAHTHTLTDLTDTTTKKTTTKKKNVWFRFLSNKHTKWKQISGHTHRHTPPEASVPTVCHHLLSHHSKTSVLAGARQPPAALYIISQLYTHTFTYVANM